MKAFTIKTVLIKARSIYLWLAIIFLIMVAWSQFPDLKSLKAHLNSVPINVVFSSLILTFFSYYFRALRWIVYMKLIESEASFFQHLLIYISGFAFTVSPGKAGELIRSSYLAPLGISFSYTFCAFITERLFDVLVVMFFGTYVLAVTFNLLFIAFAIIGPLIFLFMPLILEFFANVVKRENINACLLILSSFWQHGISKISVVYSILAWSFQGGILYLILSEFGVHIGLLMAISIYGLSLLIGAASLIPSGVGATELGMTWLLIQVGVESEVALISALFTRMFTLWPAMLLGGLSAFILKVDIET